jgi:hypothetical protein
MPELKQKIQAFVTGVKYDAANVHKGYAEQQLLLDSVYEVISNLELAFAVIDESSLDETVKADMKGYMQKCLSDAKTMVQDAVDLVDVHKDKVDSVNEVAMGIDKAVLSMKSLTSFGMAAKPIHYYSYVVFDEIEYFTEQDIMDSIVMDEEVEEETEEDIFDRYHVDNNQIVAVTYGDRDDATGVKTTYKTFILNYNTFAVVVEYNNVKYTIPSGGYIVLYN